MFLFHCNHRIISLTQKIAVSYHANMQCSILMSQHLSYGHNTPCGLLRAVNRQNITHITYVSQVHLKISLQYLEVFGGHTPITETHDQQISQALQFLVAFNWVICSPFRMWGI